MVDVALVKEAEDARAWEELNKDDPHAETAIAFLRQAALALGEAESYLQSAAEAVEDNPETDRIASLMQAVEDLTINVRSQIRRL